MGQQQPQAQDPLVGEVGFRLRLPLPVVIPIGAAVAIALVTIAFSRVLLAVPKEAAVVIALVTAVNILGACVVLAYRPRANVAELAAIVLYPVIIGIAIAQFGIGEEESHSAGEEQTQAGASGGGGLTISAQGVQFNTKELELPANKPATISFDNQDSVEHNIAIYQNQPAKKELFKGEIIPGGESTEYKVPGLPKGNYVFICDVHPTSMTGKVVVQ